MKKAIRKFILTNSIILCLSLIILGAVTVKQRSDYNMYRSDYTVLSLNKKDDNITLNVNGKQRAEFDFSPLSRLESKKKYLKYTPFGSAYYFIESTKALF